MSEPEPRRRREGKLSTTVKRVSVFELGEWSAVLEFARRAEERAACVLLELGVDIKDAKRVMSLALAKWDDESVSLRTQRAARLFMLAGSLQRGYEKQSDEVRRLIADAVELAVINGELKAELADDETPRKITRRAYLKAVAAEPGATQERLAELIGVDARNLRSWQQKHIEPRKSKRTKTRPS